MVKDGLIYIFISDITRDNNRHIHRSKSRPLVYPNEACNEADPLQAQLTHSLCTPSRAAPLSWSSLLPSTSASRIPASSALLFYSIFTLSSALILGKLLFEPIAAHAVNSHLFQITTLVFPSQMRDVSHALLHDIATQTHFLPRWARSTAALILVNAFHTQQWQLAERARGRERAAIAVVAPTHTRNAAVNSQVTTMFPDVVTDLRWSEELVGPGSLHPLHRISALFCVVCISGVSLMTEASRELKIWTKRPFTFAWYHHRRWWILYPPHHMRRVASSWDSGFMYVPCFFIFQKQITASLW